MRQQRTDAHSAAELHIAADVECGDVARKSGRPCAAVDVGLAELESAIDADCTGLSAHCLRTRIEQLVGASRHRHRCFSQESDLLRRLDDRRHVLRGDLVRGGRRMDAVGE